MSGKSKAELDNEKRNAAQAAVNLVQSGMVIGLGTGSTAAVAIELLGKRIEKEELKVVGIPTSKESARLARHWGIPLSDFQHHPEVDITIDGADRFDPQRRLIKGGGGALLHEKIVAFASKQVVIIADSSKMADPLGGFPVPVECSPFGVIVVQKHLEKLGLNPQLRLTGNGHTPVLTDEANVILDLQLEVVEDPEGLSELLGTIPGVLGHGLFLNLADVIYMGQGENLIGYE